MKRLVMTGIVAGVLTALLATTSAYAMQIFVAAPNGHTITLDVEPSDSIEQVKALVETSAGVPVSAQTLEFGVVTLDDGRTLSDYNVQRQSTIRLVVPVPTWTDSTLAGAVVGSAYRDGLATDAVSDYVLASGQLPPGISLAVTGELTGTPTAPGDYSFVVRARSALSDVDLPVTLVVAAAPDPQLGGTPSSDSGTTAIDSAPADTTDEVRLASTGVDTTPYAPIALLLFALGGAAIASRARRARG